MRLQPTEGTVVRLAMRLQTPQIQTQPHPSTYIRAPTLLGLRLHNCQDIRRPALRSGFLPYCTNLGKVSAVQGWLPAENPHLKRKQQFWTRGPRALWM